MTSTETTTSQTETEDVFSFTLEQRPSNVFTQQILGLRPYILLRPELDENDQAIFNIEVGGGAELEGLGELLEGLGSLIQEPEAAQKIGAAIAAAKEAIEELDEDEDL